MRFQARRPNRSEENILPLTNIVFLLLIFFMLAGRLSAADPFRIDLPVSASQAEASERTIVVARAVISRADATHRARWVLVHGEVSDARSLDGAPVRLPFPAGARDNRVGLRRRVSLELSRDARDRALTLRAARMNFAPPPPGSIAAYPVRGDGLIRLEALS